MHAMQGIDFLRLDRHLTDEERLVRDTAARFVDERIMPGIRDNFRRIEFPIGLVREMGELGFLGANLQGYGCAEVSNVAYGLIMQELERGDSGIRSFASVQGGLVMYPIHTFGSDEQKDRWLPLLARGEAIGCFGLTDRNGGSNPGGMLTCAVRDGEAFVLNGEKHFITNGGIADVAVVWAKCDGDYRGFLVERGTPGFTTRDAHEEKWCMRASVTSELSFADCRIPAANALPGAVGLKSAYQCLTQARYGIGWGVIGAAVDCYRSALAYVEERDLARHQLIQKRLAIMLEKISLSQLLALQVGQLKDAQLARFTHVSMLKFNNVEAALAVATDARDMTGATGTRDDTYPIIRHLLNLMAVSTYEGTHDMHALILGHDITKVQAYGN